MTQSILLGVESQVAGATTQLTQFPSSSAVANLIGGESQVACTNKQLTQSNLLGGESQVAGQTKRNLLGGKSQVAVASTQLIQFPSSSTVTEKVVDFGVC